MNNRTGFADTPDEPSARDGFWPWHLFAPWQAVIRLGATANPARTTPHRPQVLDAVTGAERARTPTPPPGPWRFPAVPAVPGRDIAPLRGLRSHPRSTTRPRPIGGRPDLGRKRPR